MRTRNATRADIDEFYRQKRLAVVGVSRDEKEWSRAVFRELQKRGYDVVPVNPHSAELDGVRCYARLADIAPAVDGALILLPAGPAMQSLAECAAASIKRVWLRNHVPGAEEVIRQAGITLISGYCPFMFMPNTPFFHKFHAWGLQLVGQYPK